MNGIFTRGDLPVIRPGAVPADDIPVRVFHGDAFGVNLVSLPVEDVHGDNALVRHPALHEPVFALVQIEIFRGRKGQRKRRGVAPDAEGRSGRKLPAVRGGILGFEPVGPAHQQFPAGAPAVPGQDVFPVGQGFPPVKPWIVQAVIKRQEHFACRRSEHRDFTVCVPFHFRRKGNGEPAFFRTGRNRACEKHAGAQQKSHDAVQPGASGRFVRHGFHLLMNSGKRDPEYRQSPVNPMITMPAMTARMQAYWAAFSFSFRNRWPSSTETIQ